MSEYRKMFGVDFQHHDDSNLEPVQPKNDKPIDDAPPRDIINEGASSNENPFIVKDLKDNLEKIKKYQNVTVVDLSAISDKASVSPF